MTQGNAVPESLANFHCGFCYDSRREIRALASVAGTASRAGRSTARTVFQ